MSEKVYFWFDPTCPWTWVTSRWLVEVGTLRDIDITWRPFSLYELNKDKDVPAEYMEKTIKNRCGARACAAVAAEAPEKLGDFYTELGERMFVAGEGFSSEVVRAALEAVGLSAELCERGCAGEFDEDLVASTAAALELVGGDVGVPIIEIAGVAFFGPVISKAPKGDEATSLWDGALAMAKVPSFYELKRSRNVLPDFS